MYGLCKQERMKKMIKKMAEKRNLIPNKSSIGGGRKSFEKLLKSTTKYKKLVVLIFVMNLLTFFCFSTYVHAAEATPTYPGALSGLLKTETVLPKYSTIPGGTIFPQNTVIPSGTAIPVGTIIPEGSTCGITKYDNDLQIGYAGLQLADDLKLGGQMELMAQMTLSSDMTLPDMTFLSSDRIFLYDETTITKAITVKAGSVFWKGSTCPTGSEDTTYGQLIAGIGVNFVQADKDLEVPAGSVIAPFSCLILPLKSTTEIGAEITNSPKDAILLTFTKKFDDSGAMMNAFAGDKYKILNFFKKYFNIYVGDEQLSYDNLIVYVSKTSDDSFTIEISTNYGFGITIGEGGIPVISDIKSFKITEDLTWSNGMYVSDATENTVEFKEKVTNVE